MVPFRVFVQSSPSLELLFPGVSIIIIIFSVIWQD